MLVGKARGTGVKEVTLVAKLPKFSLMKAYACGMG